MKELNRKTLTSWLDAERRGLDARAETMLFALFQTLPAFAPSPGFADRIAAVAGLAPATGQTRIRALSAAALAAAGLVLALAWPLFAGLARVVAPGEALGAAVRGFVALAGRIDEALSLWQLGTRTAELSLAVGTSTPVLLTLVTLSVLAGLTWRGLNQLLSPQRSSTYV